MYFQGARLEGVTGFEDEDGFIIEVQYVKRILYNHALAQKKKSKKKKKKEKINK